MSDGRHSHIRCVVLGYPGQLDSATDAAPALPGAFCFSLRQVCSPSGCSQPHIWLPGHQAISLSISGALGSWIPSEQITVRARQGHAGLRGGGVGPGGLWGFCVLGESPVSFTPTDSEQWGGGTGKKTTPTAFLKQISESETQPPGLQALSPVASYRDRGGGRARSRG